MGTRRRVRAAALAAALIALGLAVRRPRLVPELRPGTRSRPPAAVAVPDAVLASAIAWPPASGLAGAPPGAALAAARRNAGAGEGDWRDALVDRTLPPPESARAASVFSSAARAGGALGGALGGAPSSAETDHVPASGPSGSPLPVRGGAGSVSARADTPPDADAVSARRTPLARGPADSDDWNGEDEDGSRSVAPPSGGEGPGAGTWTRRRSRAFPLFRPPRRAEAPPHRAAERRKVRPLLLSKALGRGAVHPPPASVEPPAFPALTARKPALLPDGSPSPVRPLELLLLEDRDPRPAGPACRKRGPHWDDGPAWHDGAARGLAEDARWQWLWKENALWWAVREKEDPLLLHRGLWWSKRKGVWFALHGGELWSWRRFSDWDAEGLIRLQDGVELAYSADYTKVAVITPGAGAVLYDAYTGAELGEWLEEELPRRRPRAPAGLRLQRGI